MAEPDMLLLKAEITNDPVSLGYSGKTDQQVTNLMNAKTRSRTRANVTIQEFMQSLVATEYIALTTAQRQYLDLLVASEVWDINQGNIRDALAGMFGAGTQTRANLLALANEQVSRATELGWETMKTGWVQMARSAQ